MLLFSLYIFFSLCFSGSLSPSMFFVFLTVSESSVQTFKWNHKGSSTQVWLLSQNLCTFCFSFSVFMFLQIHNWKFPLLSCQFLAPCAPCMLFLSLLRQMEHCLQCTRRFGLVLYLNWISALFYFFPLCHRLKIARWTWYLIVYVCECECVYVCTLLCLPVTVFEKVTDKKKKSLWISQALDNPQQECSSQCCVNKRNSMWQWLKVEISVHPPFSHTHKTQASVSADTHWKMSSCRVFCNISKLEGH